MDGGSVRTSLCPHLLLSTHRRGRGKRFIDGSDAFDCDGPVSEAPNLMFPSTGSSHSDARSCAANRHFGDVSSAHSPAGSTHDVLAVSTFGAKVGGAFCEPLQIRRKGAAFFEILVTRLQRADSHHSGVSTRPNRTFCRDLCRSTDF